jgi:O-antigen/teichoic acid export membrane protein
LDQALLSAANLLVGLLVVRSTAKADYGHYLLGVAAVLFVVSVQNALVTTQMTVLLPGKEPRERERFCAALAAGQFLVFLPLAMAATGTAAMASHAGAGPWRGIVPAVSAAALGTLLREFGRALHFQRLRPSAVLATDLLYLVLLGSGLAVAVARAPEGLHITALWLMGLASLVTGGIALATARPGPFPGFTEMTAALSEAWRNGRWALGGVTVTWLQDQSYVYLLTLLAGAGAAAEAGAARLFMAPAALLGAGAARALLPRWAVWRSFGDHSRVGRTAARMNSALVACVTAWSVAAFALAAWGGELILGGAYRQVAPLVALWGLLFALQAARSVQSWRLQAYCRFREIAAANTASAFIALLAAAAFIMRLGTAGSIIALVLGECVLLALLRRVSADVI